MYGKYKLQNPIYLVLFILMIISCPNDQMRDLVELKVSDPVADTFIINSGDPTAERTVTLYSDVTKEEDALEMRFKNSGYDWSDWEAYTTSKTWTLPFGDSTKTVYAQYRDEGHHVVEKINYIELNTGAPSGDFYIWGTAISGNQHEFINSQTVTLCMNITNVEIMRFSNNGGTTWSSDIPYAATYEWTLSAGDGEKTVNAEFVTNSGTVTSAENSTASENPPVLDTTAPVVSIFMINSGDASANSTGATLTYNYTETYSLWAEYRNDGESWSASEALSGSPVSKSWTLRAEEGIRTAETRLTDIAGNVSSVYSDDIDLDTAAPATPTVTSAETYTSSTRPLWTWNSVPGAVSYRYNRDNTSWSEEVPFTTYTPGSDLTENTSHTLYVRAVDSEGRESESGSFTVYIDTEAPAVSNMSLNQTYFKSGDTVVFNFTAADLSGIDIASSYLKIDSFTMDLTNISGSDYVTFYTLTGYIADGSWPIEIYLVDHAGNSIFTSFSAAVIDNTSPVISNFTINSGNTYSCSPYGRVTISASDVSDLTMQLEGNSYTPYMAYANSYDIENSGTVNGFINDEAGNVSSAADTITMKTSAAEDTRYENQSMPSHLASAAYDLGSVAADWESGGDHAEGGLSSDISGEATLWDEDWYKLTLDTGYDPTFTITANLPLSTTSVRVYYDSAATQLADFTYDLSGDGLTGTVNINWDQGIDGEKTIWIRIFNSGEYYGNTYDMEWFISIL